MIRFLRRDDETHEIRRYLGAARILQSDLVPIVKNHHNDDEILDLILRYDFPFVKILLVKSILKDITFSAGAKFVAE